MKFTTIFITRKKIITALAVLSLCIIGAVVAVCVSNSEAVETFSQTEFYEGVLSEGLPESEKEEKPLKEIINDIIGFDADKLETIAAKGLHYNPQNTTIPEETAQPETVPEPATPAPTETPVILPDRNAIRTATGISLNNATSYTVNTDELCAADLPFKTDDSGAQVLVVHTHTTECYSGDAMSGETERTTDDTKNVIEVGRVICNTLEEYGIKTVHDTTVHDYPSYQSAYTRTLKTIEKNLQANPSIKVVIDVHRDAFIYADGSNLRVAYNNDGVEAAKVMLVVGTDSMGLSHPEWRGNLSFAAKIQNAANIMYPGLMRPIDLRRERFNMHMTKGSILLEVGSNGNSLEEAKLGAKQIACAIAAVLKNGEILFILINVCYNKLDI